MGTPPGTASLHRLPHPSLAAALVWSLVLWAPQAPLRSEEPPDSAVINRILSEQVAARQSVGIVVGLDTPHSTRFFAAGTFDGAGTSPVDADTLFENGSVTKILSTTTLADMVIRHEVALEDPVAKHLGPTVSIPSRDGRHITLLDLATHTSGLPRLPGNLDSRDGANPFADYSPARLYAFLAGFRLPRNPGERYEYSNLGVAVLGDALARRAGTSYETVVSDRVLVPLKMRDTRIALSSGLSRRFTPGHDALLAKQQAWELSALAGAGAFRSTARDMLQFVRAYARPRDLRCRQVAALALESRRSTGMPAITIGLGWHIVERNGRRFASANGLTGGHATFAGFEIGSGVSVIVLSNTARSVDDIGWHILDPSVPLQTAPAPVRRQMDLPESELVRFVGTFEGRATGVITIAREKGALWVHLAGMRYEMFADGPRSFFLKAVDAQIVFTTDPIGNVSSVTLTYAGTAFTAHRVR
jgi:D-alanyl-D-alanine-carboxypeptidase/D-alanyl-D-alanine-endopeptidase